ncbi:MAG: hypothetical protein ACTIM4_07200 [Marinomonas sp.]
MRILLPLLLSVFLFSASLAQAETSQYDNAKEKATELWGKTKDKTVELAHVTSEKATEYGGIAADKTKETSVVVWDKMKELGSATADKTKQGVEKIREATNKE